MNSHAARVALVVVTRFGHPPTRAWDSRLHLRVRRAALANDVLAPPHRRALQKRHRRPRLVCHLDGPSHDARRVRCLEQVRHNSAPRLE